MRPLTILAVLAVAAAAMPAAASAQSGFAGTYTGETDEGQPVSVQLTSRGLMKSIDGAAIRTLTCFSNSGNAPSTTRTGPFPIDKTVRSNTPGRFTIGDEGTGLDSQNNADGVAESGPDRAPVIKLRLFIKVVEADQSCSGSADATLTRTSGAPVGDAVKLKSPKTLRGGKLKAFVPKLSALGDDGIGISASHSTAAAGGTIDVSVKRARSGSDTLGFGSGTLGEDSAEVKRGRRKTSLNLEMKRPRRTPASGDRVPMAVTVTFTDKRGRSKSAATEIVVREGS